MKLVLLENQLVGQTYIEPYAGGASIALSLLFEEYADEIWINDIDRGMAAFWRSVLTDGETMADLVMRVPLNVTEWQRQREVYFSKSAAEIELGFATFYLNRTNRSGIITGGLIGGVDQTGSWKMDARFNRDELRRRIEKISRFSSRIVFSQQDAAVFLSGDLPSGLIYLDPPYVGKGAELYTNWYENEDHAELARVVDDLREPWLVSYDAVPQVAELYCKFQRIEYSLSYSTSTARSGTEWLFPSPSLALPSVAAPTGIRVNVADATRVASQRR